MATRVPENDPEFNLYITGTNTYLLAPDPMFGTNWQRLGLLAAEMASWTAFRNDWVLTYALYGSDNTRTPTVTKHKNDIKANFATFNESLLTRMEGSPNIVDADRAQLNIPKPDRTPTARGPITTAPDASLTAQEGAKLQIRLRVDTDATRASIHPLADGWQMVYKIGTPAPANPEACPNNHIGTKALTVFEGGMPNDGKKLYAFFRWVNISNPANNGPWSAMEIATISGGTV